MDDMRSLEPSAEQREKMENVVLESFDAANTTLLEEWIALFKVSPLFQLTHALVAGAVLMFITPLGTVPLALLQRL